ncbi:DeoR/GlpR family DNA-binding transcription regulator [bacterium]|nr:DeoR/GlpR family DNA-binding transcription regulator [bacterium]
MENSYHDFSKVERQAKILELLYAQGKLKVDEVCSLFDISKATARRDMDALVNEKNITRFHGGILIKNNEYADAAIPSRSQSHAREKMQIGKAAAALVQDGETIFLASGTTVFELARHLHQKNVVVVTNSLLVMNELVNDETIELISTGGILRRSERSFIGHISQKSIEEINTGRVFLGTYAIDPEKGLTHDYLPEVMTDRAIMRMSDNVVILADHSKFLRAGSAFLAPISRVNTVITDRTLHESAIRQLENNYVQVIIA